ncbi:carbohydrate-binding protein [Streptosporangium sp. NPDC051022]|uniref:carbohydrate-binding protein n=1 Tax=Streptosporangium sp. NPDC051022 TaxID=3155752 RepID=UPI003441CEEC
MKPDRAAPAIALITTVVLGAGLYCASSATAAPADHSRAIRTTTPTSPFPAWTVSRDYKVADMISYDGHIYQCIQAHSSLAGWEPPGVPALWRALG